MALDLNAIKAAAAKMQEQAQAQAQDVKPETVKTETKAKAKAAPKGQTTKTQAAAPKTDTPKQKGGAKYVIPAAFKQAIEDHLKGREDMKEKLSRKGKSIDGCCDYIFDVMRRRAEKERGGKSAVGIYADPQEVFGMAVHYYDETEESLKSEE